jgi:hypothetical protein
MSQTVTLQIELLYDIGASAAFVAVRYALLRIPSSVLIWLREAYELRHSQCQIVGDRLYLFHSVASPPSFKSYTEPANCPEVTPLCWTLALLSRL